MIRCLLTVDEAYNHTAFEGLEGYDYIEINLNDDLDFIDSAWGYTGDAAQDFGEHTAIEKAVGEDILKHALSVEEVED